MSQYVVYNKRWRGELAIMANIRSAASERGWLWGLRGGVHCISSVPVFIMGFSHWFPAIKKKKKNGEDIVHSTSTITSMRAVWMRWIVNRIQRQIIRRREGKQGIMHVHFKSSFYPFSEDPPLDTHTPPLLLLSSPTPPSASYLPFITWRGGGRGEEGGVEIEGS